MLSSRMRVARLLTVSRGIQRERGENATLSADHNDEDKYYYYFGKCV